MENGALFTANYPLLIRHIIREAELYRNTIEKLEQERTDFAERMFDTENFWNRIMMEHALFIRGLLTRLGKCLSIRQTILPETTKSSWHWPKDRMFRTANP